MQEKKRAAHGCRPRAAKPKKHDHQPGRVGNAAGKAGSIFPGSSHRATNWFLTAQQCLFSFTTVTTGQWMEDD